MAGRLTIVAVICAAVACGCLMAIRMRRRELRRSLDATDKRLALVSLLACAVIVVLVVFGYVP
jgi:hypothetical protein